MITILVGENGTGKSAYLHKMQAEHVARGRHNRLVWHIEAPRRCYSYLETLKQDSRLRSFAERYVPIEVLESKVGAHFLLPVVVAAQGALFTGLRHSLLMIEYPELGMHPSVIPGVVAMLLKCVSKGVFVAVETHSEAFVSCVCEAVEAGTIPSSHVSILLFRQGQDPSRHEVAWDGTIQNNWPIGVFAP